MLTERLGMTTEAIPAVSDLKRCFALALHELGVPACPCDICAFR